MQYFDILLFAVIAGFLLVRLHRVLGRRTGHESPPPESVAGADSPGRAEPSAVSDAEEERERAEAPDPGHEEPGSTAAGLAAVRAADPTFDPERFLGGAGQAFTMIVTAFAEGEREPLRGLLSEAVFRSFESSMAERERDGLQVEMRDIRVAHASIANAGMEGTSAWIQVEFESEKIEVVRDSGGAVVDGDPEIPARANDLWTFSRNVGSADPNWTLVRTGE